MVDSHDSKLCERCGSPVPEGDKFCGVCGAEVSPTAPTGERLGQSFSQGTPVPIRNRGALVGAIAIVVLLALLVISGVFAYATFGPAKELLRGSERQPVDEDLRTQPPGGQEDTTVNEEPPPEKVSPKPTPGYELVKDNSGSLTVEVPSGWSVITGEQSEGDPSQGAWSTFAGVSIGSSITASSDLDAWYNPFGAGVPGMYAVASRKLAQKYTDDQLVLSGPNDRSTECARGESQNFTRSFYLGRIQTWNCEGRGSKEPRMYYTLSAAPQGRECVVVLEILAYSKADRDVAQHILNTIEVDCKGI